MDRLPGFRDFYPDPLPHKDQWSAQVRNYIFDSWRETARRYGFQEYDGPPLETLELYTTKSGAEIVGQLYNFTDKGDREISLRPEMTPTLARMVARYERNYPKPIKWFSIPQLFRYERQQRGRLREHFQFNADILGESDPASDAELMALVIDTLRAFGLTAEDFYLRISSRSAWQDFYEKHQGDPSQAYEFFQVIDKLERSQPEESQKQLQPLGFSLDQVQSFIKSGIPTEELQIILDNLGARGLSDYVAIDYRVIRGLAYYTGPVFEAFDRKGKFRAIAGGGRYDNLVQLVSGGKVKLPALGFGMGDVVLKELLEERGLLNHDRSQTDVFLVIEDESLRQDSLKCLQDLRNRGVSVDYSLTPAKANKQFKRAMELNARFTVRLDKDERGGLTGQLKNLTTREVAVLPWEEIATTLADRS